MIMIMIMTLILILIIPPFPSSHSLPFQSTPFYATLDNLDSWPGYIHPAPLSSFLFPDASVNQPSSAQFSLSPFYIHPRPRPN